MSDSLPKLVLTGASGFVGRTFLLAVQDQYRIYAIARRSQQESRVPRHPNIEWIQVDIGNAEAVERVTDQIEASGGADFVLHLAAYYDFANNERPEYRRTNVDGTRHLLEQARRLNVKRFIFASSVAACPLPDPGGAIDENSPPDADFPYARSKKAGELMMREYSQWFPCSIVRLAAVFSDWCEYPPLYIFLSTWLGRAWNAHILGGRGMSAVPYIHTRDLNRLFAILLHGVDLPRFAVYTASPQGATTHRELFDLATRFRFGQVRRPILIPKPLAAVGVALRDLVGRMLGNRPFERLWMMRYLDTSLTVDASHTCELLDWTPTPRLHITRRILFLIEKMKSNAREWTLLNEAAMKRSPERPALAIHDAMMEAQEAIVDTITAYLQSPAREGRFPHYEVMSHEELRWHVGVCYALLRAAVRTNDRTLLLQYMHSLARKRYVGGFPASELCDALLVVNEVTLEQLLHKPQIERFEEEARDAIALSTALAIDGVQDAYDSFLEGSGTQLQEDALAPSHSRTIARIVERLNIFYSPPDAVPGPEHPGDKARP